ncbi:hypothetical protein HUU40_17865 [candidate division KSB1 bacterium]|nr:hypothetical protein [candidate division KSB1 bacterium]
MFKSLRYILTIAAAERMMLYRTAKFWVLAGIGVLIILFFLVAMTIASIVDTGAPGEFLLTGTDAFLAIYFFSYVQAILIIFVAGDFHKAEEKSRLEQVMLSRPMTTANWVMGKYLGIVSGLFYLNLFLIALATIGRVFKVIFMGADFNILPFLKYVTIAALPAMLFMTSLVFFLVSLLRSQALAIILPLGYVAAILFYFHHQYLGLLDYGAFFAPLFHSDLIGFGDITRVLWQRLFFVLLAIALLCFSIILYPRLEQSLASRRLTQFSAAGLLLGAALVAYTMISQHQTQQATRRADYAYQQQWTSHALSQVKHYDFDVTFHRKPAVLDVNAKLAVANPNPAAMPQLLFALNGALRVSSVTWHDGAAIPFEQKHQLLQLELGERALEPGAVDTLQIAYTGKIDADGFMLDRLPESKGLIRKDNGPWIKGSISAWLGDDFAVLPAQCGWYPVPGAAAGYAYETPRPQNFATAMMRVRAHKDLRVITQGELRDEQPEGENTRTTFEVPAPVPGFSLNLGAYQRLARTFKQTEVELYFRDKHLRDYELFAEVADTCYEAIERMFEIFEEVAGVPYPFARLALVETPLQMQIYMTPHGIENILQQPGIVMFDEVNILGQRFKKRIESRTSQARRRGRDDSPARIKRDVFVEAVLDFLLPDEYWRGDGSYQSPVRNYVHFQRGIADPVLSRALELQLYEECERRTHDAFYPDRWNAALSSFDRIRQMDGNWTLRRRYDVEVDSVFEKLEKTPLAMLRPQAKGNLYRACVDFKAPPVLQMLRERVGEKNYAAALRKRIAEHRYQLMTTEEFLETVQLVSDEDLHDFYEQWFEQPTFPGYRISLAEAYKLDTGKMHMMHQVRVRVQNGEKGDGFVRVVCKTENDNIRRNLRLGSYEEKEIQFAVAELPKNVQIIPYFSRNRGEIMKSINLNNRVRRGAPRDTVFTTVSFGDSLVFVLDDQDEGFFTPVSQEAKYLRPPSKGLAWWENTNPLAYGKYYFGFRIKSGGSGDYPARWEANVPRSGDYDLSFHLPMSNNWWSRNMSRTFQLTVTSAEGKNRVNLQPQETADGWLSLGRYHFKKDSPAIIELSDAGSGFVIADAVRWEMVE